MGLGTSHDLRRPPGDKIRVRIAVFQIISAVVFASILLFIHAPPASGQSAAQGGTPERNQALVDPNGTNVMIGVRALGIVAQFPRALDGYRTAVIFRPINASGAPSSSNALALATPLIEPRTEPLPPEKIGALAIPPGKYFIEFMFVVPHGGAMLHALTNGRVSYEGAEKDVAKFDLGAGKDLIVDVLEGKLNYLGHWTIVLTDGFAEPHLSVKSSTTRKHAREIGLGAQFDNALHYLTIDALDRE